MRRAGAAIVRPSELRVVVEYAIGQLEKCGRPFPNLLVHSVLGIHGRPYFYSSRDSIRGCYTAKSTRMFTDLCVLDQCRYYYDWFPTVPQVPSRFGSHAFQVLVDTDS